MIDAKTILATMSRVRQQEVEKLEQSTEFSVYHQRLIIHEIDYAMRSVEKAVSALLRGTERDECPVSTSRP